MAQRTSLALFLATASMIGGSAASAIPVDQATFNSFSAEKAQLLAGSTECVPVGEGENCERETRNKRKAKPVTNPAANPSTPTSNPEAR